MASTSPGLHIALSKSAFYAGEAINGAVILQCDSQTPQNAKSVKLKLIGIQGIGTPGQNNSRRYPQSAVTNIRTGIFQMENEIPLDGTALVPLQQINLPFTLQLPAPGSFPSTGEWPSGYIRYTMEASMPGIWATNMYPPVTIPLHLYDVQDPNKPHLIPMTQIHGHLKTSPSCCGGGGNVDSESEAHYTVKLDRGFYMPGETVIANIRGRHNSTFALSPNIAMIMTIVGGSNQTVCVNLANPSGRDSSLAPNVDNDVTIYGLIPQQSSGIEMSLNTPLLSYRHSIKVTFVGHLQSPEMPIILGAVPLRDSKRNDGAGGPVMDNKKFELLQVVYFNRRFLP